MEVAPPSKKPTLQSSTSTNGMMSSTMMIVVSVIGAILGFIFSYGAARLSYNTYGSYAWAFLAFIFSGLYYPYYAFFISRPAGFFGGKRHR